MARYSLQGGTYALAVEQATGRSVDQVIFLFLHTGTEISMVDLVGAKNDVRDAVADLIA